MNKHAMMVEVIGGSVVSVAILFIIVLIFSNSTSGMIEDANKKALTSLLSDIITTQNTPVSGGEHASGLWQLIPEENTVYSLVYVPGLFASKVLDLTQHLDTDWKSRSELRKCIDFPEACLCLFKATTSKSCSMNYNIITLNAGSNYSSEITAIESWVESNLNNDNFNSVQFLSCAPLKESGCKYIDIDGNLKPCIIHYAKDKKPLVWMYSGYLSPSMIKELRLEKNMLGNELENIEAGLSSAPTTLKFETMTFKLGTYSDSTTYPMFSFVLDTLIDYPVLDATDKPICTVYVPNEQNGIPNPENNPKPPNTGAPDTGAPRTGTEQGSGKLQ